MEMGGETKEKQQETLADRFREIFGLSKEAPNIGPPKNAGAASPIARDGVIRTVNYNSPTTAYRQKEIVATREKSSTNNTPLDPLILTDFFYSNYLPYSGVKEQSETTASPLHRAIVDAANTSDYRDRLRTECLGNVTTSMAATLEMTNVLLNELQNMVRNGNRSQKEAAQQLLNSLKNGAQLGEDVSKQLQKQAKRQQRQERKEDQGNSGKEKQGEQGAAKKQEGMQKEEQDDGREGKQKEVKPRESDDGEGKSGKSKLPFHLPAGLPFGKNSKKGENSEQSAQDGSANDSSEEQQQGQAENQSHSGQTGAPQGGINQPGGGMPGGVQPPSPMQEQESDEKTEKNDGEEGERAGKKNESTKKDNSKRASAPETGGISSGMPTQEAPQAPTGNSSDRGGAEISPDAKANAQKSRPQRTLTKAEREEYEREANLLNDEFVRKILQNIVREKAAQSALKKAETTNKIQGVLNSDPYGGGQAGGMSGTNFASGEDMDKVLKLAENTDIMNILDILNTIPSMKMPSKKKYTEFTGGEQLGLRTTGNPEKARVIELALPDEIFYQRMAEGELSSYRRGIKERSTGPIYLLLDKSGSMSGLKMTWAKAVAIKFYQIAKKEKKDFYVRFFGAGTYERLTSQKEARRDQIDMVTQLARVKGEDYDTRIQEAVFTACDDIISHGVTGVGEIILITDGIAPIDEAAMSAKLASAKAKLISIMIQGDNEILARMSKGYLSTTDLSGSGILKLIEIRQQVRAQTEVEAAATA